MTRPTQAGYLTFIRDQMGITIAQLPDDSAWVAGTFNVSVAIVSIDLCAIDPLIYTLSVYNLAGDRLLNYAPDQSGQTFFATARKDYKLNSFVAGVIQSAGDEATNESMLVPDFFKNITLMDLQNLKTPYGRTYLEFAQSLGTLWGTS